LAIDLGGQLGCALPLAWAVACGVGPPALQDKLHFFMIVWVAGRRDEKMRPVQVFAY
jgi:hypothetical protein